MDIKGIAKRVGTSTAAVSFVLNNKWHKKVRRDIAAKIKQTAKKYNYTCNPLGKGLVLKRHFRIGLCIQGALVKHPIIGSLSFHELLSATSSELNRNGYSLNIMQIKSSSKIMAASRNTIFKNNDGIVFLGWNAHSIKKLLYTLKLSLPYVVVDVNLKDKRLCYCYTDMSKSAAQAIRYFVQRGHGRIGFVGGGEDRDRFFAKLKGYRRVLSEHNIPVEPDLIYRGTALSVYAKGYEAGEKFLSLGEKPTAIFCSDNMCAIGLMSRLQQSGVRVPREVEVIGFGDKVLADLAVLPLSYVRRPIKKMATVSVKYILNCIKKDEELTPRQTEYGEELIFRSTTRRVTN